LPTYKFTSEFGVFVGQNYGMILSSLDFTEHYRHFNFQKDEPIHRIYNSYIKLITMNYTVYRLGLFCFVIVLVALLRILVLLPLYRPVYWKLMFRMRCRPIPHSVQLCMHCVYCVTSMACICFVAKLLIYFSSILLHVEIAPDLPGYLSDVFFPHKYWGLGVWKRFICFYFVCKQWLYSDCAPSVYTISAHWYGAIISVHY